MASPLDLQEQEQLESLKSFWKQYGNLITWLLVAVLAAYAAWNGWNWWQRDQGLKASAMYDELERAAQAGDADKAGRVFNDLKSRYAGTTYAEQGALVAAKAQFDKGQTDPARATLQWAADNAREAEYQTVARLRLAGLMLQAKQYDDALKQLDAAKAAPFAALVADRRGDVLLAQGKKTEALAAYQQAWKAMEEKLEYRRLIEAKLTSLGAAPEAPAPAVAASGAQP